MEDQPKSRRWKQNPEAVRADILRVAQEEFARNGLSRTRIEDIADRTKTSKRMVFYYFGDKESLYKAVLEAAYAEVRAGEAELDLEDLPPDQALRRLVEFTFDHHRANPDFIRLVMVENIHGGSHMSQMEQLAQQNLAAIRVLERICEAGREAGLFREDISALALHWRISAMSFFNVSNRATFALNFGDSLFDEKGQALLREEAARSILLSVLKDPTG
ncbi:TetR family transcriptional regulator [Loktanella sp. 22II-4b]|uniref:TetR/AcrR family transcriptional regulator n=1 Tax=Brevirhabdus pacifica TaxID=1267768 RepID=UPI0009F95937|nr:TetR/AcrR family transcriptional regulator [Brevirhabdus pacifica]OWU76780.1 TetR family transcriptional regulator [Loktanella sp. 22II-4b]PJJ86243.1 TetR family transcriptional regulator [Brevirhabdus pacifica]